MVVASQFKIFLLVKKEKEDLKETADKQNSLTKFLYEVAIEELDEVEEKIKTIMMTIPNIIDPSGKVILDGQNLAVAIALLLNTDESNVKISYEDPDVACIGKVNPIKKISTIKVNGYDFNLMYNKEYNVLGEEFDVSLSSVLIFKIEAIKYGH